MKRIVILLIAAFLAACSPRPVDAPTVLTYGTPYAPTHPFSRADRIWMEFVAKRSGGRLVIKPYWSGALLSSDHSMIEVRHDVVDIGLITPIYARGGAEVLRAQSGFYGGVKSYAGQLQVYDCLAAEFPDFGREGDGEASEPDQPQRDADRRSQQKQRDHRNQTECAEDFRLHHSPRPSRSPCAVASISASGAKT